MKSVTVSIFFVLAALGFSPSLSMASKLETGDSSNLDCNCISVGYPKFRLSCIGGYEAFLYGRAEQCNEAFQNLVNKTIRSAEDSCECVQRSESSVVDLLQVHNRNLIVRQFTNNPQELGSMAACLYRKAEWESIGFCKAK